MKIAIIGGSGKMGRWFADFLLKEGYEVVITGRNQKKLLEAKQQLGVETATNEEAVKNADVVILSVPIDNIEEIVKQISPYTSSGQVIVDFTSIKVLPVEIMHRHIKAGVVLGVHPVFGPGAKEVVKHNFVLTPTNEKEETLAQKIKEYLEVRGARVTLMTPGEHDEMMAVILGLSHFIAIVSAEALVKLDMAKSLETIGGSTYKVLLSLVGSVISEDPELYASLQMSLPNMAEIENIFQRSSKFWADLVKNKDRQEFVNRMNFLRNKLEEGDVDFGKAYENIYKLAGES
ncbi:prephenate dehydrogenase [Chloroflexota bacterium]